MLGLSTVWQAGKVGNGSELLDVIESAGLPIGGIELEYRVPARWFEEVRVRLRRGKPRVLSVHNFFPLPDDRDPEKATGDLYSVTSEDPEERRLAIKHTLATIEIADDLGAQAVVLHLGRVPMEKRFKEMRKLWEEQKLDSPEMERIRSELREERAAKAGQPFEWVLFALDRLNREAFRRGVRLGVENRYYFSEIPSPDEIGNILQEFAGGAVGYWHDAGHSHVLSFLGFPEHDNLLERYHRDLAGIHLHDARGITDHLSPGKGEINFAGMLPRLGPAAVRMLELRPEESLEEVRNGADWLLKMGF